MQKNQGYWFQRHHKSVILRFDKHEIQPKQNVEPRYMPETDLIQILKVKVDNLQKIIDQQRASKQFYQFFVVPINNNLKKIPQIRCFKHNSMIILYCQTEKLLLCSNCMFGGEDHSRHQVIQLSKVGRALEADLRYSQKILKDEQNKIEQDRYNWQKILIQIEKQHKNAISQLENEQQKMMMGISNLFLAAKAKMDKRYSEIKNTILCISTSLKNLVDCLSYHNSIESIRHLYLRSICVKRNIIQKQLPSLRLGEQMRQLFERNNKVHINKFKKNI